LFFTQPQLLNVALEQGPASLVSGVFQQFAVNVARVRHQPGFA
jgi:hypothetical protein